MGLISTDAPPAPPAGLSRPRIWRRLRSTRVSVGSLVLAVAAAGALGAIVTDRWQAQQRRLAEESTVSLVALPANTVPTFGSREVDQLQLEGRLVVVNSGPLPVEIDTLYARQDGLTLQGTGAGNVKAEVSG
ncbi:MAG TPA: hypothetical protein VFX60_18485 [Micromonospora sp.]|nr:hypothetical protein [Micromonospora sp.]